MFVQGVWHSKIWSKFHSFTVFHISVWWGLELCLGGISPPQPPVAMGLPRTAFTFVCKNLRTTKNLWLDVSLSLPSHLLHSESWKALNSDSQKPCVNCCRSWKWRLWLSLICRIYLCVAFNCLKSEKDAYVNTYFNDLMQHLKLRKVAFMIKPSSKWERPFHWMDWKEAPAVFFWTKLQKLRRNYNAAGGKLPGEPR